MCARSHDCADPSRHERTRFRGQRSSSKAMISPPTMPATNPLRLLPPGSRPSAAHSAAYAAAIPALATQMAMIHRLSFGHVLPPMITYASELLLVPPDLPACRQGCRPPYGRPRSPECSNPDSCPHSAGQPPRAQHAAFATSSAWKTPPDVGGGGTA